MDLPGLVASTSPVLIHVRYMDSASREYVIVSPATRELTALRKHVLITALIMVSVIRTPNVFVSLATKVLHKI